MGVYGGGVVKMGCSGGVSSGVELVVLWLWWYWLGVLVVMILVVVG